MGGSAIKAIRWSPSVFLILIVIACCNGQGHTPLECASNTIFKPAIEKQAITWCGGDSPGSKYASYGIASKTNLRVLNSISDKVKDVKMLFSEKTRSSVYLIPPSDITPEIEDEVINQKYNLVDVNRYIVPIAATVEKRRKEREDVKGRNKKRKEMGKEKGVGTGAVNGMGEKTNEEWQREYLDKIEEELKKESEEELEKGAEQAPEKAAKKVETKKAWIHVEDVIRKYHIGLLDLYRKEGNTRYNPNIISGVVLVNGVNILYKFVEQTYEAFVISDMGIFPGKFEKVTEHPCSLEFDGDIGNVVYRVPLAKFLPMLTQTENSNIRFKP